MGDGLEAESIVQTLTFVQAIVFNSVDLGSLLGFVIVSVLLVMSGLISGSEVAFFSMGPKERVALEGTKVKSNQLVLDLLAMPEKLLATILIANNLVNVGIVIISSYVTSRVFNFTDSPVVGFIIQIILITFLLLLFGEIVPKVYASKYASKVAVFMAYPLFVLEKVFRPISSLLIKSTSFINRRFQKKQNLSIDDLSEALDIAGGEIEEDQKILRGIVKFGNIEVKEILKSRVDVVAFELATRFNKLISVVIESGYSRIPVFEENFDQVKGILYIKDLLPYIQEDDDFEWQKLIRDPFFVPETKKIDDLLEEFKNHKNHMAIVIDEYGGTSGIVTLEDVLEEIVGEITDELDDEDITYKMIDNNHFVFEGKTLLNDFYKIVDEEDDFFDVEKGDADTLAGLILEYLGEIPQKNDEIKIKHYVFKIKSVDIRRIKQVDVTIKRSHVKEENN